MAIIIFILGTIIGSFLNVCIYRIPNEVSIAYPPSHCYSCEHKLGFLDLVPIMSFIFLKGKCRYCGAKFSVRYPMIEGLTGLLFLGVYINYGLSLLTIKYLIFTAYLIVITFIDLDYMIIPDQANIVALAMGIPFLVVGNLRANFFSAIVGLVIGAGIIAFIRFISRGGMGDGDVYLMGVVGFYIGYEILGVQFLLALITASFVSLFLIITKIKSKKDFIPFGPFIAIGAWVASIWGISILNWYKNIFL